MRDGTVRERFTGRIAGVGSTSSVRIVVGRWDDGPWGPFGRALALVSSRVATAPAWCSIADPIARVALAGVRTRGTAGCDRREWCGATSVRAVTAISGSWRGTDLGALADVDPPCRFGFSSTPRRSSVTSVVTTSEWPA